LIKSYYFVAGAFYLPFSVAVVALGSVVVVVALGSVVVVVALGSVVVAVSVLLAVESAALSPPSSFLAPPQEARENTNARTNKRFKNFMVEMF
jgi:hypothetical protein